MVGSAFAQNPLNQLLDLEPPLVHALTAQDHYYEVLVRGSQARPRTVRNPRLYPVKPVLEQLVRVLVWPVLHRAHDGLQQRVPHELTR